MKLIKSTPVLPVIGIKNAADLYKTKLWFSVPHQVEKPWGTRKFEALDLHLNLLVFYE